MGRKQLLIIIVLLVLLLSIGKLTNWHVNYFLNLAAEDYYVTPGKEPEGLWLPTAGAAKLGLGGKVQREELRALFEGRLPDGTNLVKAAHRGERRPGWDLCFSAPKDVSVLWAVSSRPVQQIIQRCQQEAVTEVLNHIEREVAFSRQGKAGSRHVPASIVAATFEHATSRGAHAPQLHTHTVICNVAVREDGSTGTLESRYLYKHKMMAGALYRAALARLLQERLGLRIARRANFFEIPGVPKDLCRHFSDRRRQIEERLAEKGQHSAAAAAVAAVETRPRKTAIPSRAELFRQWRETAASYGFTWNDARRLLHRVRPQNTLRQALSLVDKAVDSLLDKFTSFDRKQLLQETLYAAVESGVHVSHIRRAVEQRLQGRTDIVHTTDSPRQPRYTTMQITREQKDTARAVDRLRSAKAPRVPTRTIDAAVRRYSKQRNPLAEELDHHMRQLGHAFHRRPTDRVNRPAVAHRSSRTLKADQADALRHLVSGPGRIKTLRTSPTEDRYLMLDTGRDLWQKAGYTVKAVSLSNAESTRFQRETGIDSTSLKRLELGMHPTFGFQLHHHVRQLGRAWRHKKTYKLDTLRIDRRTVLVVDGAERLSTKQLAQLTRDVAKQGGQLILVEGSRKYSPNRTPTAFDDICRQLEGPQPDTDTDASERRQRQLAELRDTHDSRDPSVRRTT